MKIPFTRAIKHAWNAFKNARDPTYTETQGAYSSRPDRTKMSYGVEKSIISSIYSRISIDVSSIDILHTRVNENNQFVEKINSSLNEVIGVSANVDQTGRALMIDIVLSLFDEGCIAVVPTDISLNPEESTSYNIQSLRVGKIIEWYPEHVRVRLYNEKTGQKEEITIPKKICAIIENPLYLIMNEHNSTIKRLIRKINLLDAIDEQSGSGKFNLIFQLPFVVKGTTRQNQANDRLEKIEQQLANSKYGIAYVDATEKVTQLNRPIDNNLMSQIEFLTEMLYNQLGVTKEIMSGTADEKVMLNYFNRTVEPVLMAITDEFKRKFLTKTARTQMQTISYYRNPFGLVPVNDLAEIADKFTRNEILSSNEFRGLLNFKKDNNPKSDQLINSNMPVSDTGVNAKNTEEPEQTGSNIEEYLKTIGGNNNV